MSQLVHGLPDRGEPTREEYQRLLHAFRDSEDRLRLLLTSGSEAIFGCDQIGTCIFCNDAAARVLGYDHANELIGKNMHETEHHTRPDGTPYPLEECPIFLGFQEGKAIHRTDEVFWRKDGTSFPVEYWSHVMVQNDRALCVVVFTDISARRHAEEALRKSEEFKARLIASSTDCISVLDLEGRLLSMNEGGMQVREICDLQTVLNSPWIDFWNGEDRQAAQAAVKAAAADGATSRFMGYFPTRITKQPKWWDVIVGPIRGSNGKPEFLLAVSRDITEHQRNEKALREAHELVARSEKRWRAVFENSLVGVALTDLNGQFLAVNDAYQQMLGYSEPELLRLTFLDVTHDDYHEASRKLFSEVIQGERDRFQIEKRYLRKDDSVLWGSTNVSLIRGTETTPTFIIALVEDITARKQAEEALRKSEQRNRTLLEINNAIITNLTREALFQSVSEALRRVMTFDRSALALYEPLTDTLRFVAFTGNHRRTIGDEVKRTESSVGWVFDHRQAIVRGDLEKEAQYPNERHLRDEGLRSHCIAPLMARGKCIGTLNITSKAKFQYSQEDAQFLQEAANQVALAVENMHSYEEIAELKAKLEQENVYLQEEIRTEHNFEEIVGNSPTLLAVLEKVEQVAPTDSTVLIYGETGTGKELIARAIHDRSLRKNRPLVKVNCSAISAGLVESELFGHVKGAFTGALERRTGRFELADGGTIFLDEVGELPLETQVKLLRVLQEREFEPVGSNKSLRVNVRLIAATNRNLGEAIQAGRFRSDLFYRLNVFPLELPPLRERPTDIPKLAKFFLSSYSKKLGKRIDGLTENTMEHILKYPWPGNVRELQNVIERAVVLSKSRMLELQHETTANLITESANRKGVNRVEDSPPGSELPSMKEIERNHIVAALKLSSGVIEGPKGAAGILHMHPNTLRHRITKLGIKRSGHHIS